jgi:DNA-binding HxlR family transcriptional regulator
MSNQIEKNILCPVSKFTEMLGGKWKLIIIDTLRKKGVVRFGQLAASIPKISRKVLTDQLKELVVSGLVKRKQFNEIPLRVEYSLSLKSENLFEIFNNIDSWVKENIS